MNKFESRLLKDDLWQVWLSWPSGSEEKDSFNSLNVFSPFGNYLPLGKGGALHLKKIKSPSSKNALYQVWLKLALWFWRRTWKCEKFMKTPTTTTTDNGQILMKKAHLSLRLRGAKKCRTGFKFFHFFRFENLKLNISLFSFIYFCLRCFYIHCSNDTLICYRHVLMHS